MSTFSVSCLVFSDKTILLRSVRPVRTPVAIHPFIYCHIDTQKPLANPKTIFKHNRLVNHVLIAPFNLFTNIQAIAMLSDEIHPVLVMTSRACTGQLSALQSTNSFEAMRTYGRHVCRSSVMVCLQVPASKSSHETAGYLRSHDCATPDRYCSGRHGLGQTRREMLER